MKRVPFALLLAAALAPAVACAGESLRLVERATGETVVHRTSADDALGDLIVFANPLYDAADKRPVGASRGSCTRVEVGRWWDCHWTMTLDGGALLVAGPYPDEGDAVFGIVGGTGRYAGARGTVAVHSRDAAHESYDFVISLL